MLELKGGAETIAGIILGSVTEAIKSGKPVSSIQLSRGIGFFTFAGVMTGFGSTGKWFAMGHRDVVPEIITIAEDEIDEGITIMDKALEAADACTA